MLAVGSLNISSVLGWCDWDGTHYKKCVRSRCLRMTLKV